MNLTDKVNADIAAAMKAREQPRLAALRMLKTAITNRSVEKGRSLDDAEVLQVVASLVKQRRDSIEQFAQAGRTDLVEKETAEIRVLEQYLPPAATAEDVEAAVSAAIAETGASSPKDIGKVMKAVMPKLAGKHADGRAINEAVRRKLAPSSTSSTLARSAASAGAATMTSRVLGVVREQVLAAYFGAGNAMDAFNVAFRIPNLVRDLFAEGAMSSAFVPTFTRHVTLSGRESAWRLGRNIVTALILITGLLVALGLVFAEPIVTLFAGSYREVPGKLELTVLLTRIMLPFLTFVAVAAAFMGMLNSLHRFFIPALSPAMFNVATIACAVALVPVMPRFGWPGIAAIAIGALLGGVLQLTVQWPLLRREGFVYRPVLDLRDEGLRRVLVLMGPGTIGLAATQVNVFVNTVLATGEGTGAVSWLNYAFRLMYLPIGLFGISVATATLPAVSRQAAQQERAAVRGTIADGLSLMMMLNVPATVGLIVLATPIVRVIFERGAFTPESTAATAAALQFYALGLVGYSIVRIASPTFYALGQNLTPVKVSIATVAVNAALNIVLVRYMGYRGLALGTSVAALFNAGLLMLLLRRSLDGIEGGRVFGSLLRIAAASLAMGAAAAAADAALASWLPGDALAVDVVRLAITIAVSLLVLAGAAHVLRIREFRQGVALVSRRLGRRPE